MSGLVVRHGVTRPEYRVVGLDLSLTSTGMSDGRTSRAVQTSPEDGPTEARFERILKGVSSFVYGGPNPADRVADLAVVESGAFSRGAQSAGAEQLSGLRYLVRHWLWLVQVPFALVTPTGLKAYVTGNGGATKQQMAGAVAEWYGVDYRDVRVKDGRYDLVDAFGLAAMGYHRLGVPLHREGPPPPLKSLNAVDWPKVP